MQLKRFGFVGALAASLVSGAFAQGGSQFVPGEILVKFNSSNAGARSVAHAALNARAVSTIPQLNVERVRVPAGMTVDAALRYYRGLAGVQYAEPVAIFRKTQGRIPNDPRYLDQYGLQRINAPAAWNLTIGSPTVRIAIVDSGVDYRHPDLVGKVILGTDWQNNDRDPMDDDSHGTHVAGIAAARTNNSVGVAGVSWDSPIVAIKTLGQAGGSAESVANGIMEAADLGSQVINLSLGSYFDSQVIREAVGYAIARNSVILGAAGNDNIPLKSYPAAIPSVICVGSTNKDNRRSNFSNFGRDWVDVAAPGSEILSTVPNGGYEIFDGTSMACPMAAGVVGLMRSYSPRSTAAQIRTALESTTTNVGDWLSKGLINAPAAIRALVPPDPVVTYVNRVEILRIENTVHGRNLRGSFSDLATTDNRNVIVGSENLPRVGAAAGVQTGATYSVNLDKLAGGNIVIAHRSRREATISVFAYNYRTGKDDLIKSVAGTDARVTSRIEFPARFNQFVTNAAGVRQELRIKVRAFISNFNGRTPAPYELALDQLSIESFVAP